MAKELENIEVTREVVKGPALAPDAARTKEVRANPELYVKKPLSMMTKDLKSGNLVDPKKDRLHSSELKTAAAQEFIYLKKVQDYINARMEAIKETVFETLNERDIEISDETPTWYKNAPANQIPGEIAVPEEGIRFQRAGGAPNPEAVDEKAFMKAHPRMYKNLMKKVTIPAVEERVVEVFDSEAFFEKAEKNKDLQKFIKKTYKNPQFRYYNIFDEE